VTTKHKIHEFDLLLGDYEEICPVAAGPLQLGFKALYHRAFSDYRLRALWNVRALEHPSPEEALTIARNLRVEGDLSARRLAEQIELACRAAL
jgi:hypothetical protein